MPHPPCTPKSEDDLLDLNLPVPEGPMPIFPTISAEAVYALNEQYMREMVYDEAYFVRSLAGKNPEPFVL